jgi:hypothetical protein
MSNNEIAVARTNPKYIQGENAELLEIWKELGISSEDEIAVSNNKLHPILAVGLGAAALFNVSILLSIPPVLRGRGRIFSATVS